MKAKFHYSVGIVMLSLIVSAGADIIYSGLLNPATSAIPTNFTGITVTVGDGTLNPFFGGVGVANNNFLQPGRVGTGNLDAIVNFGAGATINSGMTLDAALGYGGSSTHVGNGASQFVPGSEGYIGFKLDGANYGWMRVVFTNNTGGALVKDWAYDNSGAALVTGNVLQSAVSGNAQTVTLTSASGSFTLGTQITNSLGNTGGVTNSVVKQGAGTTVLSASNSYTGTTTVSEGTLQINGADTGGGLVSVAAAATLGGTGSTTAAINVSGVLSPGASIQSFASGALTMSAGSSFVYEATNATATGADLMVVNGALSLTSASLDLSAANLGLNTWIAGDKLTLISYTGTAITSGFTGYNDDTTYTGGIFGTNQWLFNYNDSTAGANYNSEATGSSFVTLTVVPEPDVAMLVGGLGLLALLRRRRA